MDLGQFEHTLWVVIDLVSQKTVKHVVDNMLAFVNFFVSAALNFIFQVPHPLRDLERNQIKNIEGIDVAVAVVHYFISRDVLWIWL